MLRDPIAVASFVWIALMGVLAVTSIWWTPFPPNKQFTGKPLKGPNGNNWLGTDDVGRDILSRLMEGASVSLRVSLSVVIASLIIALPIGLLSGYLGKWVDTVTMRILDAATSIPGLVAALAIIGVLGPGMVNLVYALIIVVVPSFVRIIRAQALAVSAEPFIDASRAAGSPLWRILFQRVLPGVVPALSVQVSMSLGTVLTAEAALSFLGLGVVPPNASWGSVLKRAYSNILRDPGGITIPIVFIGLTVLSFNLIGDALRDALELTAKRQRRTRLGITDVRSGLAEQAVEHPSMDADAALQVRHLSLSFRTDRGAVDAVTNVDLTIRRRQIHAIVGESGAGKSAMSLALVRVLPSPPADITSGSVIFDGNDTMSMTLDQIREVRGAGIAMVFQNPMTSLDPSFTIGNSMDEAIRNHSDVTRAQANRIGVELLQQVGISSPERRMRQYPHQLSGGMRQRVMIAMALAATPQVLIADEPTTALDVTTQAQILDLLRSLRDSHEMSIIFVTHDLGVVADIADTVTVMYAGEAVESASVERLFAHPRHPYTTALLGAVPDASVKQTRLATIPGTVLSPWERDGGCRFRQRCEFAAEECTEPQALRAFDEWTTVRCVRAEHLDDLRAAKGTAG